jgi:hypothetical protein
MDFFRQLRHLLPDALAWRPRDVADPEWLIGEDHYVGEPGLLIGPQNTAQGLQLWRFLKALSFAPEKAVYYVDRVVEDLFPETTRELDEWERQFGLAGTGTEEDRRAQLAAAWSASGGQSPRYLQDVIQAAGFNLWIHEWRIPIGPPWLPRDPRDYTSPPTIGEAQCASSVTLVAQAQCSGFVGSQDVCSDFLVNEPRYLVNQDLTRRAPPPIPADPATWVFFIYWGAAVFPNHAEVPAGRRAELERLLLKLCPDHQWLVMLVDYV